MEANSPLPVTQNILENVLWELPFGFSLQNGENVIEYVNKAWLDIVQKPKDEVLGRKIFDVFPETDRDLRPVFEDIKKSGEPFYAPEYSLHVVRDGVMKEVFYNFIYHPVYTPEGRFQYFATVVLEVTDLIGIRNKVKVDEERLRMATESSQTATWDIDLKNSEIVHSSYLAEIFGYEKDAQISHDVLRSHLFTEDRKNIVEKAFEKALQTGIYHYEARICDRQGAVKWIATNGRVFFDKDGMPDRVVGVLHDITKRKTQEVLLLQSHHYLKTAMEATKLGRFDMDFETLKKYNFSDRFLEILGYDPQCETISSELFERHIHPDYLQIRAEALKTAQKTGDLFYQAKIILKDKTEKWIEIYGRRMEPLEGSKSYVAGTIRDITELKEYEKNISESEKKYRFLADSMPQIVWIGEGDGRLTYFNQATMDYSGKNYNDFIEENGWIDIVHPDEQQENIRLWSHCVATQQPFLYEHRFRNKNNEYRWFLSRAFPEVDEQGQVTKWVGTSTDIDEMKKQEKQKNDFIKMANHELKTPVTTIKGYVQLLKKMRGDSGDKFLSNSLATIEKQVNKLNVLIGDLLDISRMEMGRLPLKKNHFSLVSLVTETIEDIKAAEHTHQINFEMKHGTDIEICGDNDRITQVLNNLLTNAIKYSPGAGRVDVELSVKDDFAIVSVQDFGIGMEEHELKKIFERFYRVSGDDEETFPGFGIGLFIVKDILERHGGDIWVESEKDKGSTFYFSLPLIEKDNYGNSDC